MRAELDAIFDAAVFDHAFWGVAIQSMDTGEVLYRRNASKLMVPASNMKILTTAVAAERLGWDYRFDTTLFTIAPVDGGTVRGDVVVVGNGDPTIGDRDAKSFTNVFEAWADTLRSAGIHTITGRIIGDDDAFDDQGLASDWAWGDLGFAYAAPVGALQFNENVIEVVIQPGPIAGAPTTSAIRPSSGPLTVVNRVVTGTTDAPSSVSLRRRPGQDTVVASGVVPAGGRPATSRTTVDSPTQYFVRALRDTLIARGITVLGDAVDIDDLDAAVERRVWGQGGRRVLASHQSAPFREVATTLMKVSQNLYAETVLRTMGARARSEGSIASGRSAAQETLEGWGIASTGYRIGDGSGLSRRDYLSPETIVAILRCMHRDPRHREPFTATLPIAGKDGTLAQRMKGTRAEGLRAKTGTLAHVRALSGYVTTADGELLAFSILANNFLVATAMVDGAVELAAERLASFTRR